jgi:hypothetical protein
VNPALADRIMLAMVPVALAATALLHFSGAI